MTPRLVVVSSTIDDLTKTTLQLQMYQWMEERGPFWAPLSNKHAVLSGATKGSQFWSPLWAISYVQDLILKSVIGIFVGIFRSVYLDRLCIIHGIKFKNKFLGS